jgi:hypothetical protein
VVVEVTYPVVRNIFKNRDWRMAQDMISLIVSTCKTVCSKVLQIKHMKRAKGGQSKSLRFRTTLGEQKQNRNRLLVTPADENTKGIFESLTPESVPSKSCKLDLINCASCKGRPPKGDTRVCDHKRRIVSNESSGG